MLKKIGIAALTSVTVFGMIMFGSGSNVASASHCTLNWLDCWDECQGLPSYPTYEFEGCLTLCGDDNLENQAAYNQCLEDESQQDPDPIPDPDPDPVYVPRLQPSKNPELLVI